MTSDDTYKKELDQASDIYRRICDLPTLILKLTSIARELENLDWALQAVNDHDRGLLYQICSVPASVAAYDDGRQLRKCAQALRHELSFLKLSYDQKGIDYRKRIYGAMKEKAFGRYSEGEQKHGNN